MFKKRVNVRIEKVFKPKVSPPNPYNEPQPNPNRFSDSEEWDFSFDDNTHILTLRTTTKRVDFKKKEQIEILAMSEYVLDGIDRNYFRNQDEDVRLVSELMYDHLSQLRGQMIHILKDSDFGMKVIPVYNGIDSIFNKIKINNGITFN